MYPVTGCLRLARHNGYFAADQGIGQRGFSNIGPPYNRDKTTTERSRHFFSWETATGRESWVDLRARDLRCPLAGGRASMAAIANSAADCSAARRLAPPAVTLMSSLGIWQSTSNS